MPIRRHASGVLLGDEGGDGVFPVASYNALELHAPGERAVGAEAELAKRNAVFRRPAARVDGRRHTPYAIPRSVFVIDRLRRVALDTGGIDVESERGAMIVITVEHDAEPVGVAEAHVASAEPGSDWSGVVKSHAHVECFVVIDDAHFGLLRGGLAFVWVDLGEVVAYRRARPGRFVELAVETDGRRGTHSVGDGAGGLGCLRADRDGEGDGNEERGTAHAEKCMIERREAISVGGHD